MIYRRHKAMRSEKLSWITKELVAQAGFLSNKYIPSEVGIFCMY